MGSGLGLGLGLRVSVESGSSSEPGRNRVLSGSGGNQVRLLPSQPPSAPHLRWPCATLAPGPSPCCPRPAAGWLASLPRWRYPHPHPDRSTDTHATTGRGWRRCGLGFGFRFGLDCTCGLGSGLGLKSGSGSGSGLGSALGSVLRSDWVGVCEMEMVS